MGFFKSLLAVITASVIAFLLGMAFDYGRIVTGFSTEGLLMVYPSVAGIAGFLGAVIALVVAGGGRQTQGTGSSARPARGSRRAKSGSAEIPGMPSFDFDEARKNLEQQGKAKE